MADRNHPVTLYIGTNFGSKPLKVRCASNRKYAVVQLVWSSVNGTHLARPKVVFRSNSANYVAEKIRALGGWSWVFDLGEGHEIWQNSSSEWLSAEQSIRNYEETRSY